MADPLADPARPGDVMPRIGFADESGTDARSPCYSIGVILIPVEHLAEFEASIDALRKDHGVPYELKWTRISTSHGAINFLLAALDFILRSPSATFDAIVVCKDLFRNWQGNAAQQEMAFYQTYTFLLRHIIRRIRDTAEIFIDTRSDGYAKQHEVVETIGNRMLAKLEATGRLGAITKVDSKAMVGVQIADLLTGVVNAAHQLHLRPDTQIHRGKLLAIERVAVMLGWDRLCYDTYPHAKFNLWHFPIEFRASPASRHPHPTGIVPYVLPADLRPPAGFGSTDSA